MAYNLSRLERLNGIHWSWVQIPHWPTFHSYFEESFSSGEYTICIYNIYNAYYMSNVCLYVRIHILPDDCVNMKLRVLNN